MIRSQERVLLGYEIERFLQNRTIRQATEGVMRAAVGVDIVYMNMLLNRTETAEMAFSYLAALLIVKSLGSQRINRNIARATNIFRGTS